MKKVLERFTFSPSAALEKTEFKRCEERLRVDLLNAQAACREANIPVIILVSGVESAGKSAVVNRMSKWLDMRYVQTTSFWHETDEERARPFSWRYWRRLPRRDEISILFGSWYTQTIIGAVSGGATVSVVEEQLQKQSESIKRFEALLSDDGVVLVKLWFHLSQQEQSNRIAEKVALGHVVTTYEKHFSRFYQNFAEVSHRVIELTGTELAPWHVISSEDKRQRDISAGEAVLAALFKAQKSQKKPKAPKFTASDDKRLASIDLSSDIDAESYDQLLDDYQARLARLHWQAWNQKRSTVLVFEGWDAAGKGGVIRRLTAAMDARLYRVMSVGAPSDEELAHHYLWRFWKDIPQDGYLTIYDRSWYGRVLVERVEGLAKKRQWKRAYQEINDFEKQLTDHGIRVVKFWLQVSPDEQLQRFEDRKDSAYKSHKLTDEDWRNRDRWSEYESAVEDMLKYTDRPNAPWYVIPANSKPFARVEVIKAVCHQLEKEPN